MSTFFVTNLQDQTVEIELRPGWSLMEVLREEGYEEIYAMCGGSCSCATCHVHIDASQALPPVEEDEEMLLMSADSYDAKKSRLSCQIPMTDALAGLRVTIVADD